MDGKSGDEHLRDWADLHMTRPPSGFVGGWLRTMAAIARPLARAGVSPNVVTVAAFLVAVATIPLAAVDGWVGPAAACVALIVSGLLDALDGAVAVQAGRTTKVGFLLDSALDRLSDAALPVALAIVADTPAAGELAVATVAVTWWLEYVRARASLAAEPASQVVTPGERPTRMILTGVGLGLPVLAVAALWGQVVIVGGSALFLFGWSLRRLATADRAARAARAPRPDRPDRLGRPARPDRDGGPPSPTP
ncbi:MAG: archaetidylinositol phosphate synthase [Actinomycetota bacterium]|nr:archaetidylinositol phosphate synthase [Actinomycetota bacterium]